MVEAIDHMLHDFAQVFEIEKQHGLVELASGERHPYFVVVPVRVLTLALVVAEEVPRSKRIVDSYLVHTSPGAHRQVLAGTA